jgi:hypothetical protein
MLFFFQRLIPIIDRAKSLACEEHAMRSKAYRSAAEMVLLEHPSATKKVARDDGIFELVSSTQGAAVYEEVALYATFAIDRLPYLDTIFWATSIQMHRTTWASRNQLDSGHVNKYRGV